MPLHTDAITEYRAAGVRASGVDSNHAHCIVLAPIESGQTIHQRTLARTGRAGDARQICLAGLREDDAQQLFRFRLMILNRSDRPRDREHVPSTHALRPLFNWRRHRFPVGCRATLKASPYYFLPSSWRAITNF